METIQDRLKVKNREADKDVPGFPEKKYAEGNEIIRGRYQKAVIWGKQCVGWISGFLFSRFDLKILDMDLLPSVNELMEGGLNQTKIY